MAFDVQLCEALYKELGRDQNMRLAYRAYLRQHAWQLVKHALCGEQIGLACLRSASSSGSFRLAEGRLPEQAAAQRPPRPEV
jgi:hypothetical protein